MKFELSAPDFSLNQTLECGQAFRWKASPAANSYYGYINNSAVKATQQGSCLIVEGVDPSLTADLIRNYFALDVDLPKILDSINVDGQISEAINRHYGLRILRQNPWECLASFILSSFNNIKRIQLMIERICQAYGACASFNGFRGCSFPAPTVIARASERSLRLLGLGFRAPYLRATARMVADGKICLNTLRRTDYFVTRQALMNCDGVGEKVADCVSLFGFEKYESFPVDVWIERAMRYYFGKSRVTPARAHNFARKHFGRYAGYAQQYLYQFIRNARKEVAQDVSGSFADKIVF
jgi:N-glycosylase/DNA lyase